MEYELEAGPITTAVLGLYDQDGLVLASNTAPTLAFFEQQVDGSLKTYDFSDDTFKSGAVTTSSEAMTSRLVSNGTVDMGNWTHVQAVVSGFTAGAKYYRRLHHPTAAPDGVWDTFVFGRQETNVKQLNGTILLGSGSVIDSWRPG